MQVSLKLIPLLFLTLALIIRYFYQPQRIQEEQPPLGSGLMFDSIADYYDAGLDTFWRQRLIDAIVLQAKEDSLAPENRGGKYTILDLATGTGEVALMLSRSEEVSALFSDFQILGLDPSVNMLKHAKIKASKENKMIEFNQGNAEDLASIYNQSISAISMSFGIRNVANRPLALQEMSRVSSWNGHVYILEFFKPSKGPLAPLATLFLTHILPNMGALASNGKFREYEHLKNSILNFPSPERFVAELEAAGFHRCITENIFFHVVNLFICEKTPM